MIFKKARLSLSNFKELIVLVLLFILPSCSGTKHCNNSYDVKYNGNVKVGEPYTVKNKTYIPKIDPNYEEVGMASWYGKYFHCLKTANGESFNKNQLSAAHKTLPLPSIVKVTNLSNGKSVNVIINDRGPFTKNRIIDLSEEAAIRIGMKREGVARVKIQFLSEETDKLMKKLNTKNKIFYNSKPHHKYEIKIDKYEKQKIALTTMRKLSKFGKTHILAKEGYYLVMLGTNHKHEANQILNKVHNLGYKNAKIIIN